MLFEEFTILSDKINKGGDKNRQKVINFAYRLANDKTIKYKENSWASTTQRFRSKYLWFISLSTQNKGFNLYFRKFLLNRSNSVRPDQSIKDSHPDLLHTTSNNADYYSKLEIYFSRFSFTLIFNQIITFTYRCLFSPQAQSN